MKVPEYSYKPTTMTVTLGNWKNRRTRSARRGGDIEPE